MLILWKLFELRWTSILTSTFFQPIFLTSRYFGLVALFNIVSPCPCFRRPLDRNGIRAIMTFSFFVSYWVIIFMYILLSCYSHPILLIWHVLWNNMYQMASDMVFRNSSDVMTFPYLSFKKRKVKKVRIEMIADLKEIKEGRKICMLSFQKEMEDNLFSQWSLPSPATSCI